MPRNADTVNEAAEEPTLEDLIRLAMRAQSIGLRVGVPARVLKFDPGPPVPFVEAEIALQRVTLDDRRDGETAQDYPPIPLCPVEYPRGGGYRMVWPLGPGDGGWLKFSDRALETWLDASHPVDPQIGRTHALSDAVFVPGLNNRQAPQGAVPLDAIVIEREDGTASLSLSAARAELAHALKVDLGGPLGLANARVTDPTLLNAADIAAINTAIGLLVAAPPGTPVVTVAPFGAVTGTGTITGGSAKVVSE